MYRTIHADGTITTPNPLPAGVPVGDGRGVVKPEEYTDEEALLDWVTSSDFDHGLGELDAT